MYGNPLQPGYGERKTATENKNLSPSLSLSLRSRSISGWGKRKAERDLYRGGGESGKKMIKIKETSQAMPIEMVHHCGRYLLYSCNSKYFVHRNPFVRNICTENTIFMWSIRVRKLRFSDIYVIRIICMYVIISTYLYMTCI